MTQITDTEDVPVMTRFEFVKELGYRLIVSHLQKRLATPSLQRDVREAIKKTLGDDLPREHRERDVQGEEGPSESELTERLRHLPSGGPEPSQVRERARHAAEKWGDQDWRSESGDGGAPPANYT
ncbi:hypothetical protein J6590_080313 [Homalodisca vitripennis]|nr:hypothetical protein J6590_080313 [Homalodisca vitripennis]